jgi:hypothetical protein
MIRNIALVALLLTVELCRSTYSECILNARPRHLPWVSCHKGRKVVVSAASSVSRYATMAREPIIDFYCSADPRKVLKTQLNLMDVGIYQIELASKFPNFRLIQTDDPTVFFDARPEGQTSWASPLQCFLELMAGDKRDKERRSLMSANTF